VNALSLLFILNCLGHAQQESLPFPTAAPTPTEIPTPTPKLGEPKFGPEFTFYSDEVFRAPGIQYFQYVQALLGHLVHNQPAGAKFVHGPDEDIHDQFVSPSGWRLSVSTDPGVIEVHTNPMTVEGFETFQSDMQDGIFVTAANLEMFPALFVGGGHLSIDGEFLLERPLLMRNLLADLLVNHVELFLGIFGYDTNNALPLILVHPGALDKIRKAFKDYDDRFKANGSESILTLVKALNIIASNYSYDAYQRYWIKIKKEAMSGRYNKYGAVNFSHIQDGNGQSRLELRGVRPQASMDVWIRQIRLVRNRLRYLSTIDKPIPLIRPFNLKVPNYNKFATTHHALQPPVSAHVALKNFRKFVEESGERIEDHLDYVWPRWHTDGSVQSFLASGQCDKVLRVRGRSR
jgi:hypothetical protein